MVWWLGILHIYDLGQSGLLHTESSHTYIHTYISQAKLITFPPPSPIPSSCPSEYQQQCSCPPTRLTSPSLATTQNLILSYSSIPLSSPDCISRLRDRRIHPIRSLEKMWSRGSLIAFCQGAGSGPACYGAGVSNVTLVNSSREVAKKVRGNKEEKRGKRGKRERKRELYPLVGLSS